MTENEFLLEDRKAKIKSTVEKYGEDQFYISFSGGKDSVVLSSIVDEALPGNTIPRVYCNTGIEFNDMVEFVQWRASLDPRITILKPKENIKRMLEEEGYPFKSKDHSKRVREYQIAYKHNNTTRAYAEGTGKWGPRWDCPKVLREQFTPTYALRVSDKCCDRLKKDIGNAYAKENGKTWCMTGIRRAEGGARINGKCIVTGRKINKFNPLLPVDNDFVEWYVWSRIIVLCKLYYPPYNFERTGCKGCPFNIHIQKELDTLQTYLPREREQCEIIWKPVYDEYRRLGYRLRKPEETKQLSVFDFTQQDADG